MTEEHVEEHEHAPVADELLRAAASWAIMVYPTTVAADGSIAFTSAHPGLSVEQAAALLETLVGDLRRSIEETDGAA